MSEQCNNSRACELPQGHAGMHRAGCCAWEGELNFTNGPAEPQGGAPWIDRWRSCFGADLTLRPDDALFIQQVGEIYNEGFEAAHALRQCGHSVGDYRDAGYIPCKPETYTASEQCVGCAAEQRARREARLDEAKWWFEQLHSFKTPRGDNWQMIRIQKWENESRQQAAEPEVGK